MRSPFLSLSLFGALVVSIAIHLAREREERFVHVVALATSWLETRPEIRIDFDAEMADTIAAPTQSNDDESRATQPTSASSDSASPLDAWLEPLSPSPASAPRAAGSAARALPPGAVRLTPAVAVDAYYETPRRMRIVPRAPLARFTTVRVTLGPAVASRDGRPVASSDRLQFTTGRLALEGSPVCRIGADERAFVETSWNGELAEGALALMTTVKDATGRAVPFTWSGVARVWSLRLATIPEGPLSLEIAKGLRSREGGEPLGESLHKTLAWSRDLEVARVRAVERGDDTVIDLSFSRPLAAQDLAGLVTVVPAPAGLALRANGGDVRVTGEFAPGSVVAVTAKAGLRAGAGLRLPKDVRRVVRIPEPSAFVEFVQQGSFLSTEAAPELVLEGRSTPEVVIEVRRVPEGNVVPLALHWRDAPHLAGDPIVRRIAVDAAPHKKWTKTIDLKALLGEAPRGVFEVRALDPRESWSSSKRLLDVSDLAPVVRVRPDGLVVSVARLSDAHPVGGARVVAWDRTNRKAVEGTTDAQGLFVARGLALEPRVVTVSTTTDLAFVDVEAHRVVPNAREVEGREPAAGLEAWMRADRGVVRPGETIRVDAILRTMTLEAPAEGLPAVFTLRGPDRRVVKSTERRTTASGFLDAEWTLSGDAPTGTYAIELRVGAANPATDVMPVGRTAVRVEAFVPDRIEAKADWPAGPLALGTTVPLAVSARLLSGDAAAGRTARVAIRCTPVERAPSGAPEGFVFGDADEAVSPYHREAGEATLDVNGKASIPVALPGVSAGGRALHVVAEVEVVDVSGRAIVVRVERDAVPAIPRLGVRANDASVEIALAGRAVAKARATLERIVIRGSWSTESSRRGAVRDWVAGEVVEKVGEADVEIRDGRGVATFPEAGDGLFRVTVRAAGCAPASTRFSRESGRVAAAAPAPDPVRVRLRALESAARPSAALPVEIVAPFAGRGLLTVEGVGVFEAKVVDVVKGTQRVEVALGDMRAPSLHATLTLVRGARSLNGGAVAADGPVRLVASVAVPVEREGRRVNIEAKAPEVARPEAPLVVRVKTSAPAEVRVHLVDAAILRRTRHADADPSGHFGAIQRLSTDAADAYAVLLSGVRYRTAEAEPGGDGDESSSDAPSAPALDLGVRAVVETVALASRRVMVDGEADITLPIPAFEGRLRLVVVAATAEGTGAVARDVVVRGPIAVSVHAPKVVAPGDVFDAVVETRGDRLETQVSFDGFETAPLAPLAPLTNDATSAADAAEAALDEEIADVTGTTPAPRAPTLLRVRALDRFGPATIAVRARDAAGHDVLRKATVIVRPAAPRETAHTVLSLAAGETIDRALPGQLHPATRTARVIVGAGPAIAWIPALARLRDYPYGCVEQTTSRAFPRLAVAAAARGSHPDGGDDDGGADSLVEAAIERLLSMQTSDGGLAMWPGDDDAYDFGTVYGGHFLVECKRLGHVVPADRLDALLDHLDRRVSAGSGTAYDAYVLTIAGRSVGTWLDVMADRAPSAEDRARLALAFARRGDATRAKEMLGTPLGSAAAVFDSGFARQRGGSLASPLRADALLLEALDATSPSDPRVAPLVARLTATLTSPRPLTTQEDATALLALIRHAQTSRDGGRAPSGALVAGAREEFFAGGRGVAIDVPAGAPWTFSARTDQPVTVVVRTVGVPVGGDDRAASNGATIRRRLESLDGRPPAPGALARGRLYRVVLEGTLPANPQQVLVTDVLPGGFEVEEARAEGGTLAPDRVEVRDDRVLFFCTAAGDRSPLPLTPAGASANTFRQTYTVRAVSSGTFRQPAARVELLYDPDVWARSDATTLEIAR